MAGAARPRNVFLIAYVVLLVASGAVRFSGSEPKPRDGQQTVTLAPIRGDEATKGDSVRFAYYDSGGAGPVVVLLHGSPVASPAMMGLHREFKGEYRVLTPDLPGFPGSSIDVPDYSVRAHARYVVDWLSKLRIESAHLVAYSMSGGVALEAYRLDPARTASVTMLSAIGVQELELTGDYLLNHAVHGLQLGALWLVREAIPHFGYLDDAILGVSYARNFYDTDQRPLRGILSSFDAPMLIMHSPPDGFVPIAAAREHARLVPQSVLHIEPLGGHGLPFAYAERTAQTIKEFIRAIDAAPPGEYTRAKASSARLIAAEVPFDPSALPRPGAFATGILMTLVAMATMVSEDLATIGSGLMAARGTLTFLLATIAALVGIVVGDMTLYLAGRWLGRPMVRRAPFRWFVSEDAIARGETWFEERGIRAVLIARFIPGTRLPTYVAAGILKAPPLRFFGYFFVAAALWTPALVGLAMLVGQQALRFYESYQRYALLILIAVVVLLLAATRVIPALSSHRGRRLLISRWRRTVRWEFWPAWLFYPPVVLYVLYLGVRFRSLTLFTAANPGIPDGGFVGESKRQILDRLPAGSAAAYTFLPRTMSAAERQSAIEAFSSTRSWPVVVKPDVGERGNGVLIARNPADLPAYLSAHASDDLMVQEYVSGLEYGLFFVRESGSGSVFSITEKRLTSVVGDGHRNLEDLILDDDRAVCAAPIFLERLRPRLREVPSEGERVTLIDVGTHSKGATFLDGAPLLTEALRSAVERVTFDGFDFGRFDVRAESADALQRGKFTILELNGVTSEATHIYHPGSSIFAAYRTLFRQWRYAFEIGQKNRMAGALPTPLLTLAKRLVDHYRTPA